MFRVKLVHGAIATIVFSIVGIAGTAAQANAQDRSLWLASGESATVEGYFSEGETIYGSCDEGCDDLDLFLYDVNGTLIYQDTNVDSAPIVMAPYEGTFVVEVAMPSCVYAEGCTAWVSSDYGF